MARDENFNGLRRRCAVAIQDQQGKVELVHSIGYNAYEIVGCRATKAVGVMDVDGQKSPRLLFLYAGSYTPTESGVFPVVLEWDAALGRYVADEKLSEYLEDAHGADTIAGMKRALRAYDEAHKRRK